MTLQLVDNLWELKTDSTLDANTTMHPLGTYSNNFVVVNVTSDYTLAPWRQAGSIGQAVSFDNDYAYGENKRITLNSYLVLQFPLLTGSTYDLYYFPLPRLVEAKVKIWEYKGETIDASINELIKALQNAGLPRVEDEITALIEIVRENQCAKSIDDDTSDERIDIDNEYLPPGYYGY
ncbi:MAG: hypothetical protein QNJ41_24610 [Xenococcaceae cyanobacterium MO_188.B32]|nr:hypothetical protein [Xenococcaceae cyanobacterium MO_188.B32]